MTTSKAMPTRTRMNRDSITTEAMQPLALLRLLQLASPALPVGAFNFSQGLEYAVEAGWVRTAADAREWIQGIARRSLGTLDLPMLVRLHAAWSAGDTARVRQLSRLLVASRETRELREEDRHMGRALAKVLVSLELREAEGWQRCEDASFAALFALAAVHGAVPGEAACAGYLWAWCENQVIGAVKLLPLGQSAGQQVLERLRLAMPDIVRAAMVLDEDEIGTATPGLAIASARHETQYTRLFRS